MGRVPGAVHGQVFSRHCSTCEGSGVPRAEVEDYDRRSMWLDSRS